VHGQVRRSDADENDRRKMDSTSRQIRAQQDAQRIKSLRAKIDAMISSNATLNEYKSQIRIDVTPTACRSRSWTTRTAPCSTAAAPWSSPICATSCAKWGGHGRGGKPHQPGRPHRRRPLRQRPAGYSNWELSADRANASRRELVAPACLTTNWPAWWAWRPATCCTRTNRAPQNRRITITVLTHEAEERLLGKHAVKEPIEPADKQDNPVPGTPSL
jgi:chemotaxis protein MotB